MEFISAEEFLKQPVEVKKVLLEWWKDNIKQYYLFYRKLRNNRQKYIVTKVDGYCISTITLRNSNEDADIEDWDVQFINSIIPLLSEGQLRQFIEDMTGCKIEYKYVSKELIPQENNYYRIERSCYEDNKKNWWVAETDNLLQAYWKVAIEIAKESVKNEQ